MQATSCPIKGGRGEGRMGLNSAAHIFNQPFSFQLPLTPPLHNYRPRVQNLLRVPQVRPVSTSPASPTVAPFALLTNQHISFPLFWEFLEIIIHQ